MSERNSPIFKTPTLTLDDLGFLREIGRVEGDNFIVETTFKHRRTSRSGPISIPIKNILAAEHAGLVEYVFKSLLSQRPVLLPWVFANKGLLKMADYLLRFKSGSPGTFYLYSHLLDYFSTWCGHSPDQVLADIKGANGYADPLKLQEHQKALRDYVAHLQDRKLAPNRIANYVKAVKALYRTESIRLELPYELPRRAVNHDRAPEQEELAKLIAVADLRGKVIVSLLAEGAFREGTLAKLKYRHVKADFEAGRVPIHVHVEAEITKGKYHNYDTFLGGEAADYLRLYLEDRRSGKCSRYNVPEVLTDESPLIRDDSFKIAQPIGEKQISQLVSRLMKRAGLNKPGAPYKVKVHSLRKFFKTQLLAAGVQQDYVDYMMGHTIDTYHDLKGKTEFLRGKYAAANLSIEPEKISVASRVDQLKAFAQGLGLNPEQIINSLAFAEPHRSIVESEEVQIQVLSQAIKNVIKQEIMEEIKPTSSVFDADSPLYSSGAAEI